MSRLGRLLARLATLALVLRATAAVVGPAAVIAVGAVLMTALPLLWWARVVEPWLFATRGRPTPSRQPSDEERHLAFAQALSLVAARYLAACEREADPPHDHGADHR
jgi:hypothetical protein